jgi:hypothetical protein
MKPSARHGVEFSMSENRFDDRDEQAVWELLSRHHGIEPSFGFVERTLRRLEKAPSRPAWFRVAVFRWATAASLACALVISVVHLQQVRAAKRAEIYAAAQQDSLEDFDVIASLDVLNGGQRL